LKNRLRIFIALLLLIASVLFCIGAFKRGFRAQGNDFTSYLTASKALLNGTDPYERTTHFPYLYPPLLAFLLIPFLFVPHGVAIFLWFVVNAVALAFSGWLILKSSKNQPISFSQFGIALLLFAAPLQSNFLNGQVNTLVLLLCLFFFYFGSTSRKLIGGFCLALAIVIKVMPFVLLGFLLFRKRFKELLYTLLFITVLALLPALIVQGQIVDLYDSFVNRMLQYGNQPVHFEEGKKFFSLKAFLVYADLDIFGAKWFSRLFVLAAIASLELFRLIKKVKDRSFVYLSIYLVLPLLISPLSEIHHFILCVPAAVLTFSPGFLSRKTELPFIIMFWSFYFTGHLYEEGPFYFLSLLSLLIVLSIRTFELAKAPSIISSAKS
jgi:alpha-1,2-mannosyltransferase